MARKRSQLYKLRYQQVPAVTLVAVLLIIVAVFTVINSSLRREARGLQEMVAEGNRLVSAKQKEVSDLSSKVQLARTDEFIANEARTQYGYLSDGEIRFVVTNPEVLWGEEGMPAEVSQSP